MKKGVLCLIVLVLCSLCLSLSAGASAPYEARDLKISFSEELREGAHVYAYHPYFNADQYDTGEILWHSTLTTLYKIDLSIYGVITNEIAATVSIPLPKDAWRGRAVPVTVTEGEEPALTPIPYTVEGEYLVIETQSFDCVLGVVMQVKPSEHMGAMIVMWLCVCAGIVGLAAWRLTPPAAWERHEIDEY